MKQCILCREKARYKLGWVYYTNTNRDNPGLGYLCLGHGTDWFKDTDYQTWIIQDFEAKEIEVTESIKI